MDHKTSVTDSIRNQIAVEIEKKKSENAASVALKEHEEIIKEARINKVSRKRIAEILQSHGIKITLDEVTTFCMKRLGEIKKPRKLKRKPYKKTVGKKLQDLQKPTLIPSPKSGLAQSKEQIKSTPRSVFRVARENL